MKKVDDECQLWNKTGKILRYADDIVIIADTENGLQRLLYQFRQTAKKYNIDLNRKKMS